MLRVAASDAARAELAVGWMTTRGRGAQRMLAAALEAEVEAYLATHLEERDGAGRRLVVRNGQARPRRVSTVPGAVEVRAPRVNDRGVDVASGQRGPVLPAGAPGDTEGQFVDVAARLVRAIEAYVTTDRPACPFGRQASKTGLPLARHAARARVPHFWSSSREDQACRRLDGEVGVPTTTRRDSAQLNLRMEPAERDRIRAAIPRGSLNPVVIQLIMDYVRLIEASASRPQLPVEDPAA